MPDEKEKKNEKKQGADDSAGRGQGVVPAQPCCCDELIIFLDQVKCKTTTTGPGADHIQITSVYQQVGGTPGGAKWPPYEKAKPMKDGTETASGLEFPLAHFTPDHHCRIEGSAMITLWEKKSPFGVEFFGDLKPVVEAVLGRAASSAEVLTGTTSIGESIKNIYNDLVNEYGGGVVGDPIGIYLNFKFDCGTSLDKLLNSELGQNAKADGTDAATYSKKCKATDGPAEYEITLRFKRICKDRK